MTANITFPQTTYAGGNKRDTIWSWAFSARIFSVRLQYNFVATGGQLVLEMGRYEYLGCNLFSGS